MSSATVLNLSDWPIRSVAAVIKTLGTKPISDYGRLQTLIERCPHGFPAVRHAVSVYLTSLADSGGRRAGGSLGRNPDGDALKTSTYRHHGEVLCAGLRPIRKPSRRSTSAAWQAVFWICRRSRAIRLCHHGRYRALTRSALAGVMSTFPAHAPRPSKKVKVYVQKRSTSNCRRSMTLIITSGLNW